MRAHPEITLETVAVDDAQALQRAHLFRQVRVTPTRPVRTGAQLSRAATSADAGGLPRPRPLAP
jgi:hypothetical protein